VVNVKPLLALVISGDLPTKAHLKAEFRRRSLQRHPDTSGQPGEAFVVLKQDYESALDWLARPVPPAPVFDLAHFCALLRRAQAHGLPSKRRMAAATNQELVASLVKLAQAHSPDLGRSVAHYFTAYDQSAGDLRAAELERCFAQGLTNFLDAVVNHGKVADRARARILSYVGKAETRLAAQPDHALFGARALLGWIRDYCASAP
jgi:hypothetical protein